ncbi:MAG: FecR domain-containing protein [Zoogloeaceae bacterium]|nr:FecR domain-containing protein [Zoogloeaceae bacterium]
MSVKAAADGDIHYTVKPGDNPWTITTRFLRDLRYWPRLQTYNDINTPTQIPPGTVLRIPTEWIRAQPGVARILALSGDARAEGGRGPVRTLAAGDELRAGETLKTASDSHLTLLLPDESQVLVLGDTWLTLQEVSQTVLERAARIRLQLIRGGIESRVEPVGGGRFEVRTPAAVAAVRGTRFRVGAVTKQARAEVLEGRVALGNSTGRVLLSAGKGARVDAGGAPERPQSLLAAPDLTGLPAVIERLPIDLPIPVVNGAIAYRTQLLADDAGLVALADAQAAVPVMRLREAPDGAFVLRMRAIAGSGLEGQDRIQPIEVNVRPEPPFTLAPAENSAVLDERPAFEWARGPMGTRYKFELAGDATFSQPLMRQEGLEASRVQAGESLPPGIYHWRVAAWTEAEGLGPFGESVRFRRPPPGPQVEAPEFSSEQLVLRWRGGNAGERYDVELSPREDFDPLLAQAHPEIAQAVLPRPSAGTYFVRTRTIASDGYVGPWSRPQIVEVPRNAWQYLLFALPLLFLAL